LFASLRDPLFRMPEIFCGFDCDDGSKRMKIEKILFDKKVGKLLRLNM
jgi:hypothetical protein